jgi:hypothetical protein
MSDATQIKASIASGLRFAADTAGLALAAGFVYATFKLKGMAQSQFAEAGLPSSLSGVDSHAVLSALAALVMDPAGLASLSGYGHAVAAWFLAVAAVGCGIMSLLGLRSAYLFLVRTLS